MGEISFFFFPPHFLQDGKKPSLLQNPITGETKKADGQKKIQQYKIFWNISSLQRGLAFPQGHLQDLESLANRGWWEIKVFPNAWF